MYELKEASWYAVQSKCNEFYKNNIYITPYQSWNFLNIVGKGFQLKKPFESIQYKSETLVFLSDESIRCVLPLEVSEKRKTMRMRGHTSSIGHLDFIYPSDFTNDEYKGMMKLLSKKYAGYVFVFDRISEKSLTFRYMADSISNLEESECVSIPLAATWDDWLQNRMGPRTRKNLRKGYRNLSNDHIEIELKIYNQDNPIDKTTWNDINHLFAERSCFHNNLNNHMWEKLVFAIKSRDPIAKALYNSEYKMMTAMFFNHQLVAFGCGTRSNDGRFISMRHGVNMEFKDYQIGLVYTSEVIKELINNREKYGVSEFDRSRGAEQHKLGVGGVIHKNYHWAYIL